MVPTLLQVALGGAIGAALRYLAAVGILRALGPTPIPLAILSVNILGSFLIGLFIGAAALRGIGHLSPFLVTGILGGFTTFSTFSLEAVTLWQQGDAGAAALYVVLSVGLSIAGLLLGLWVAHTVLA